MKKAFLGTVPLATRPGGKVPGAGVSWWEHHISATRNYLVAALTRNQADALGSVADLWNGVLVWQEMTGSPIAGVLMAEHTALAKLLVDALAAKDKDAGTVAADALMANVQLSSQVFPRDPKTYATLLGEHVRLTGLYATALADEKVDEFGRHYQAAIENGRALGAFTDLVYGTTTVA